MHIRIGTLEAECRGERIDRRANQSHQGVRALGRFRLPDRDEITARPELAKRFSLSFSIRYHLSLIPGIQKFFKFVLSQMFYRQCVLIYPNKNRTKISRIRTFFPTSSFYSDSHENMGLHVEYFADDRAGKDVGFEHSIRVRYVQANVVLA
jgi:hypothetical protein